MRVNFQLNCNLKSFIQVLILVFDVSMFLDIIPMFVDVSVDSRQTIWQFRFSKLHIYNVFIQFSTIKSEIISCTCTRAKWQATLENYEKVHSVLIAINLCEQMLSLTGTLLSFVKWLLNIVLRYWTKLFFPEFLVWGEKADTFRYRLRFPSFRYTILD